MGACVAAGTWERHTCTHSLTLSPSLPLTPTHTCTHIHPRACTHTNTHNQPPNHGEAIDHNKIRCLHCVRTMPESVTGLYYMQISICFSHLMSTTDNWISRNGMLMWVYENVKTNQNTDSCCLYLWRFLLVV